MEFPNWLGLDGCSNDLSGLAYIVAQAYDIQPLPGWEGDAPPAELQYYLLQCERVSTGPFERGPVMALLELHTHRQVPEGCREGDYTDTAVLNQLWLDDAKVVGYLRATHGLPAKVAAMSLDEVSTAGGVDFRWAFAAEDGAVSDWTYHHLSASAYDQREYPTYRLFWASGEDSVSYMDLQTQTHTVGAEEPLLVEGTLRSPLLYAQGGVERFVGYGSGGIDAYAHGEIYLFKDTQCSEPL